MRDNRIDILRFIGLSMIILAHVGPPDFLFQLRNFDVPLMVLISGMSFALSYNNNESYLNYLWKRIKRLVLPVWLFLSIFFTISFLINPENSFLNQKTVLQSYAFINGIGYVWIIRVFLLVALAAPFIYVYSKYEKSDTKFMYKILSLLLIFEVVRHISLPYLKIESFYLISQITHYIIPYSIIFSLGLRLITLERKYVFNLSILFLFIFSALGFLLFLKRGEIIPTQQFKYPPSIYYSSYAIFVSLFLWLNIRIIQSIFNYLKVSGLINFIASNSIWIYLWHIPFTIFIEENYNFLIKFIFIFSIATFITYLQVMIINLIINRIANINYKKNIKMILTG